MKSFLFSSAALLLMISAIDAADLPFMKEGLWSIHTETIDQPSNKKDSGDRSLCRSHAYEQRVREMVKKASASCKTTTDESSAGKMVTESDCSVGGTVMHTKTVVTYSENAAHSEGHTTYNPPMGGMTQMTMIMDQKYIGACPAGIEPGDTINADGTIRKSGRR